MKKSIMILFFTVITAIATSGIYAACSDMKDMKNGGQCKMMDNCNCPFCVKGATVKVVNTKDGIQVLVTSADKATIKEIQEKGAKFTKFCCGKKAGAITPKNGVTEAKLEGNPNDMVQCPVMGKKLKKKDATAVLAYKGKTYYVCCNQCIDEFANNPDKYVK